MWAPFFVRKLVTFLSPERIAGFPRWRKYVPAPLLDVASELLSKPTGVVPAVPTIRRTHKETS